MELVKGEAATTMVVLFL